MTFISNDSLRIGQMREVAAKLMPAMQEAKQPLSHQGTADAGERGIKETPTEAKTLLHTAARGSPVEAGSALRALDGRTGDRAATNAQVAQSGFLNSTTSLSRFATQAPARTNNLAPTGDPDEKEKPKSPVGAKINFDTSGSVTGSGTVKTGGGPVSGEHTVEVEKDKDG